MKKLFLYIFLSLLLITPSQADDIKDLQIEGMSVGDSLLDYMTLEEIKKAEQNSTYYKNKKYIIIYSNQKSSIYDVIQFTYKPNDKKFKLASIDGKIKYVNNIEECEKLRKKILIDVSSLFKKAKKIEEMKPHEYDKSKNSIVTSTWIYPKLGGYIHIGCYDWGTEMYEKHKWTDELTVTVASEEFKLFLQNEAYQ